MVDVFVSMPTWLPEEYESGRKGFLRTLSNIGLNQRTIGSTDYPIEGSFDAVMRVMSECDGAVILGYPQTWISEGRLKETPIQSEIILPTPWNHIEATLARAMNKPTLVITQTGIAGGVFDRGAVNNFIYEEELSDSGWSISDRIQGALESWIKTMKVQTSKPEKVAADSIFRPVFDSSLLMARLTGDPELSDEQIKVLKFVSLNEDSSVEQIANGVAESRQRTQHFLAGLREHRLVDSPLVSGGTILHYPTKAGRKYLFDHGLLD